MTAQLEHDHGTRHRLAGESLDTIEAIITGLGILARTPEPEPFSDDEIDELADTANVGNALAGLVGLTTRVLARSLLARTLGREPISVEPNDTPDSDAALPPQMLDDLATQLQTPETGNIRFSRTERKAAFDEADALLQEIGLEEFDVSCRLTQGRDGSIDLATVALTSLHARVALLEFLFDHAERVVMTADLLLAAERNASAWEFSCWSPSPPPSHLPPDTAGFTQYVREQEYSLASRRTVALGNSIMGEIAIDDFFGDVHPRQHRLARALAESFVGVFECVGRDGNRATFKSGRDSRTFEVDEHMDFAPYQTGWFCIGRLLPLDGGVYVRSPGMIHGSPPNAGTIREAATAFGELCESLPPDLALEAVIARFVFDLRVPREMKPARTKAEAAALLDVLVEGLIDAGEPDDTLNDYMDALADQAGADSSPTQQPAKRAKARVAKQKSKRRR